MTLTFNLRIFFTKNPNPKKKIFFIGGGGGGRWKGGGGYGGGKGGGVDGWTDAQAQTNLPLQLVQQDNNCAKLF